MLCTVTLYCFCLNTFCLNMFFLKLLFFVFNSLQACALFPRSHGISQNLGLDYNEMVESKLGEKQKTKNKKQSATGLLALGAGLMLIWKNTSKMRKDLAELKRMLAARRERAHDEEALGAPEVPP